MPIWVSIFKKIDFDYWSPGGNHMVYPKWPSKCKCPSDLCHFYTLELQLIATHWIIWGKTAGSCNYYGIGIDIKKTLCSFKHVLCTFINNLLHPPTSSPHYPLLIIGSISNNSKKLQPKRQSSGYLKNKQTFRSLAMIKPITSFLKILGFA